MAFDADYICFFCLYLIICYKKSEMEASLLQCVEGLCQRMNNMEMFRQGY
jgi:hypothetical protein